MSTREERFERTLHVELQRAKQHRNWHHTPQDNIRCFCDDKGIGLWGKRTPWTHHCTKCRFGRPKVGRGICCLGGRPHILAERQEAREVRRQARLGLIEKEEP